MHKKRTWRYRVRPVEIDNEIVRIPLTRGLWAIVDIDDLPVVEGANWSFHSGKVMSGRGRLAQLVLPPMPGFWIDHIDRDPLNNRRSNLRHVTMAENARNRGKSCGTSSVYKGVSFRADTGGWRAYIRVGDKLIHLGSYPSEVEAAAAYDAAAILHFGQFAVLNLRIGKFDEGQGNSDAA